MHNKKTPRQIRLIHSAANIRSDPICEIDYLHTVFTQTSLPYRNPGDDIRTWDRKNGAVSLRIEAGSVIDPETGNYHELGLPFGAKPRLILLHLTSQAIKTGSPVIDVQDSMTAYVRELGLPTDGRTIRTLKGQLARLSTATIRLSMREAGYAIQINSQLVDTFDLWWPAHERQKVMWPSVVRLSDRFFQSVQKHAVPLDQRALRVLANEAPMALDLYCWLTQRLHRIPANKPALVPWTAVYEQFGTQYASLRKFRQNFRRSLQTVLSQYPDAKVTISQRGLWLHQSNPPILPRSIQVLGISSVEK